MVLNKFVFEANCGYIIINRKHMTMKYFVAFILILTTTFTFAQFPQTGTTSDRVEAMANILTDSYNKELVLSGVQIPLFKEVVEKYIIMSEDVIEKMDGREELDALVELQARETLEMNDILTQIQYRMYKKVKYNLQPVKTIDPKE